MARWAGSGITQHLVCGNFDRLPKRDEVDGTEDRVGKAEWQHANNIAPGVLKRPALIRHLVSVCNTASAILARQPPNARRLPP